VTRIETILVIEDEVVVRNVLVAVLLKGKYRVLEADSSAEALQLSEHFDGVIDFAAALAKPGDPEQLAPAFDSGDHLHPNAPGYQRMGNAIPLSLLTRVSCVSANR